VALLPATLFAQAQPAAPAPAAQPNQPAAPAAAKPVAYKELLKELKGPTGPSVTPEFNRMKQSGVITDAKLLTDMIDFKLKSFIWEDRVKNLPLLRSSLRADLRAAGQPQKRDVHAKITADTLKFMQTLVRENYPPVVRFNAILMIGDLNASEYINLSKEPAVPLPEALTVLLAEYENPDQLDAVKAGALLGIMRHIESGKTDPAQVKKIAQMLLDLIRTAQPPEGRSLDGHLWLRSRAAGVLARLGSCSLEEKDNQVLLALQGLMVEKDSPWWMRLEAVKGLGLLDYATAQGVAYEGIIQQFVELWLEMIEEESNEVPLSVALQSAGSAGMGAMPGLGGGMMGGASGMMPGGGSADGGAGYDSGGEIGGYAPGGVGGAMQFDQYGRPINPKPDRLVIALKDGYVAIQTALHGPGKPDPEKPRGIAQAAAGSEKAKQLIEGLETRMTDFKTLLDEKFVDWQNRVTQLKVKAVEMKTWLAETAPPPVVVPPTEGTTPATPPAGVTADAATPPAAAPPAEAAPPSQGGGNAVPGTVPATTSTPAAAATVSATP
jgi:hypothetical protein